MESVPALLVPALWTDLASPGSAIIVVAGIATVALAAGRVAAVRSRKKRRRMRVDDALDLRVPEPDLPVVEAPPVEEVAEPAFEVPPPRLATIELERDVPELGEASPRLAGLLQRLSVEPEPEEESGPVPVAWVLDVVLEDLAPLAEERGVSVSVDLDDELPAGEVLHGASALRHGLHEMLLNALDFAPEGSRVRVRMADLGLRNAVVVEDEGDGLECRELQRVFPAVASRRPDGPWGIQIAGTGRLEFRPWAGEGSCLRLAVPVFAADREPHLQWL